MSKTGRVKIAGALTSIDTTGIVVYTGDVHDDLLQKSQREINKDLYDKCLLQDKVNDNYLKQYNKLVSDIDKLNEDNSKTFSDINTKFTEVSKQIEESAGASKFSKGFKTNITVGGVNSGTTVSQGSSIEELLKTMLLRPTAPSINISISTGTSAEIGTRKGSVTCSYTKNDGGDVVYVKYDNTVLYDKASGIGKDPFVSGKFVIQLATDLAPYYLEGETHSLTVTFADSELVKGSTKTKTAQIGVYRKYFAGVCSTVPTTSAQVRALSNSGLFSTGTKSFTAKDWNLFAICIPSTSTVTSVMDTKNSVEMLEAKQALRGVSSVSSVAAANGQSPIGYTVYYFRSAAKVDSTPINFVIK